MKIDKKAVSLAGIVLILTFMLTWQLRSVRASGSVSSTALARAEQLQSQLTAEQKKNEELYNQLLTYKDQLAEFSKQAEESGGYAAVLSQQLSNLQMISGWAAVTGPGVTVVLSDADKNRSASLNDNNYIIHDEDLLKVVNELRDAGAEAIAINGERLIATSEIRCTGSTVSVNNNRYAAPYTVTAIGNAKELEDALRLRGGVVDSLAIWSISCEITQQDSLTIPAYTGGAELKYAKPAEGGTAS